MMHEMLATISYNLDASSMKILHLGLFKVVSIRHESYEYPPPMRIQERISHAPEIKIISGDIYRV
jgi:hypothetical protein